MKYVKYVMIVFFLGICFFTAQIWAAEVSVIDRDPSDLNSISDIVNGPDYTVIYEDYNELHLIPYPSHDGYAVVNSKGGFFDKLVINNGATGSWALDFFVLNTGPYTWSDYHFEFWTFDFAQRLSIDQVGYANFRAPGNTGPLFQNSAFTGSMVSWWAPEWQKPQETQQFSLYLDWNLLPAEFGLRQVATTVPLPTAIWLLGSGLIGLAGYRKKIKKT